MDLTTMQGLTPTITITVGTSTDLTEAGNVYPSIKQGKAVLQPDDFFVSAHQVDIYLTQAETLNLNPGVAEVQLNWTYPSGQRGATRPKPIMVDENQIKEVLP